MDREESYFVTVLPGGRITIPAAIRRRLDLHPGDTLVWWKQDDEIHLCKLEPGETVPSDEHTSFTDFAGSVIETKPQ